MKKQRADSERPWRELLRESFDFVQAEGGLFALDLEYYTDPKKKPSALLQAVVDQPPCCGNEVRPLITPRGWSLTNGTDV